jgi:hypothetical protein
VISPGGQKHLLWLGRVNESREHICVSLDDEHVWYTTDALRERLSLAEQICAATGKLVLQERVGFRVYRSCVEYFLSGVELAEAWGRVQFEPLSRLAAFVARAKEACCECYPRERVAGSGATGFPVVPPDASRTLFSL